MAEAFGVWLKQMRSEKGLTQESLAGRVGTTKPTIQRYEAGLRPVPFEMMLQLADALPVARSIATAVWVEANGGEIRYDPDPDYLPQPEGYSGLDEDSREFVRDTLQVAVETALKRQRRRNTIGSKQSIGDRALGVVDTSSSNDEE